MHATDVVDVVIATEGARHPNAKERALARMMVKVIRAKDGRKDSLMESDGEGHGTCVSRRFAALIEQTGGWGDGNGNWVAGGGEDFDDWWIERAEIQQRSRRSQPAV